VSPSFPPQTFPALFIFLLERFLPFSQQIFSLFFSETGMLPFPIETDRSWRISFPFVGSYGNRPFFPCGPGFPQAKRLTPPEKTSRFLPFLLGFSRRAPPRLKLTRPFFGPTMETSNPPHPRFGAHEPLFPPWVIEHFSLFSPLSLLLATADHPSLFGEGIPLRRKLLCAQQKSSSFFFSSLGVVPFLFSSPPADDLPISPLFPPSKF